MTLEQVTYIIDDYMYDDNLDCYDRMDVFGYALEEIARQAGIRYTSDDILIDLLIDKLPAFAEWWDKHDYL